MNLNLLCQTLFLNYYLPAAGKSISESWSEVSNSKYKYLLNLSKDDFKENLYETIRLGYVGLFHKYESHLKSLVLAVETMLKELIEEFELLGIEEYCLKEFGVKIYKSHHLFYITNRVSYICNCIKHYDSYPIKEPIHRDFKYDDKSKRIEISKELFKSDIEEIIMHCEILLSIFISMIVKQVLVKELEFVKDDESLNKVNDALQKFEIVLKPFINANK